VQSTLTEFESALHLAVTVSGKAHAQDANGQYETQTNERELITSACFVRMFVAFEEFLEASFGHYGTGGLSIAGTPAHCYAAPPSVEHLHRMYIGMMRFMDWSTPEKVRQLAMLYFLNGEPFVTPLSAAHSDLLDMKTVRNGASHVSRTTTAQLDSLYKRWTGKPRSGVTAYEMLTTPGSQVQQTFMGHAESVLRATASQIAHYT
jgi:hypothetical protein